MFLVQVLVFCGKPLKVFEVLADFKDLVVWSRSRPRVAETVSETAHRPDDKPDGEPIGETYLRVKAKAIMTA